MKNVISNKYIFLIDRKCKPYIISVPSVHGIFYMFFLPVFLISRIYGDLYQLRYKSAQF